MDASYWDELVGSTVRGKRWIAALEYLNGLDRFAERMVRQGADGLFVLAGNKGTGNPPPPGTATWHLLGIEGADLMDGIRQYENALRELPDEAVEAVDKFDPDRRARVLRTVFSVDHPVAGRPSYGARPQRWVDALEDKVKVDTLWDTAGVPSAPSAVVGNDVDALNSAASDLDQGMGTVWAGDNAGGWHGGATYTRWVRDADSAAAAADLFTDRCEQVRIMPFLDGIPCSIHGMVIREQVIAFRPVELVILRRADSGEFFYAGAATTWDAPQARRDEMRQAAVAVGEHVRDAHGYQGAFNLDGVLTEDGWWPTEFNARFAAGLATLQAGFDAPLFHLHMAMIEGEYLDYRATELEKLLVATADEHRRGGFGAPISVPIAEERSADIVLDGPSPRFAADGEEAAARVTVGPSAAGGFLRVSVEEPVVGAPTAPFAAAVLGLLDAEWQLGIGPVEAAPDVS